MANKFLYIIAIVLLVQFVSLQTKAQQPSAYEVKRMPFNINGFSNISPVIVKDGIIFCSDRRFSAFQDRTGYDGRRLYNIYLAEKKDTSDFMKPKLLKGERSNKFNNGPLCFAPDGKTVYFTSEVETGKMAENKNFKNHSGIFIAELSGTDLVNLRPFKYNDPQFDIGQPSISKDGKYIFFASSVPGGYGRSDLYYCESVKGEWSAPVNLGPKVNSAEAENYPYMHPSGRLYFSSDKPGGIGKLDVYYTSLINGSWEDPVLLPEPINSTSDDFAFVAEGDLQKGYFSSNRHKEDDIYQFVSTIIRKVSCDTLSENSYCYRFFEENAVKYDTMPFRYEWKFGDGNKAVGPDVVHCFNGPGTYMVQLDAVNLVTKEVTYNEKSETVVVTEIEQPYISAPDRIGTNQKITLSADSTNLPGWKISRYYWNFGDETIAVGKEVPKSYLKPGTYNIQLIVTAEPEPGTSSREACISKNIIVFPQP
jgi:Tol biopolymer transport system component